MLSLSSEYLHVPCEIKTLSNEPLINGYVEKITDDYIEVINTYDKLPLLPCNTYVKLNIYSSTEQFCVLIGTTYLSTEEFIRIADVRSVTDFEKRNFFRVTIKKPAQAQLLPREDEKPEEMPWFPIVVQDLSLSGMLLRTEQNIVVGDRISVDMDIYQKEILLPCSVVRKVTEKDSKEHCYGCEFLENTGRQFDLLCKYIFELQRQEIQRIRQKMDT